jgi:dTMP kinase
MILYFEGVDGVGKTTIMKAVARDLIKQGITNIVLTKEPGGPAALWNEWDQPEDLKPYFGEAYNTGALVRELCVNHPEIPQLAKRALYKADSFCNWTVVSQPAIASDKIVLSDRGWLSDIVYGSVLLNMDAHSLHMFNTALVPELPDLTYVILFTCSEEVREARLAGNTVDHMDKLGVVVRNRLDHAYRSLIPSILHETHYEFIDSNKPVEDLVEEVRKFIQSLL